MFKRSPLSSCFGFILLATVILGLVFVGGWFSGGRSLPAVAETAATADLTPFWEVWRLIDERYATTTPPTEERVWAAIGGLVDSLNDPYSVFFPPTERKLFEDDIRGNFGGLGIEIGVRDSKLVVIAPLPDTPAKRAGIRSGDQIIRVDDKSTADMSVSEAVELIRGEIGTKVKLTISRKGERAPLVFDLTRRRIEVPTIKTEIRGEGEDKTFVIRLFNFSANASSDFRNALREFIKAKTPRLIVDVRGNPGGYLESAVDIASWFLPLGEPIVYESRGSGKDPKVYRSRGYNIFSQELRLAILVDGGSASASEIFAAALSEHGRARLVGEKTFGKGSVQELISLPGDSAIKLTVAHWLTPNGHDISSAGLTPQTVVELSDDERRDEKFDKQLEEAVRLLK